MIELLFPDGTVVTGESWAEVERALRASQPYVYKSRREFRADMRHRAEVWSGRRQKPFPPWTSRAFIISLVEARMCQLLITDPEKGE